MQDLMSPDRLDLRSPDRLDLSHRTGKVEQNHKYLSIYTNVKPNSKTVGTVILTTCTKDSIKNWKSKINYAWIHFNFVFCKSSQEWIYSFIYIWIFSKTGMCVLSMHTALHCLKLILIHDIVGVLKNILWKKNSNQLLSFLGNDNYLFLLNGILASNLLLVVIE